MERIDAARSCKSLLRQGRRSAATQPLVLTRRVGRPLLHFTTTLGHILLLAQSVAVIASPLACAAEHLLAVRGGETRGGQGCVSSIHLLGILSLERT